MVWLCALHIFLQPINENLDSLPVARLRDSRCVNPVSSLPLSMAKASSLVCVVICKAPLSSFRRVPVRVHQFCNLAASLGVGAEQNLGLIL